MKRVIRRPVGARMIFGAVILLGVCLFAGCIVWPTVALVIHCVTQGFSADGLVAIAGRPLRLLWRSIELSVAATLVAHAFAIGAVYMLARFGNGRRSGLLFGILAALLTCPPMAYVFGWSAIVPRGIGGEVRCVAIWALWIWPIPMLLLDSGWSRVARDPFLAATLETETWRAFRSTALPALRGHLTLSLLVVFTFLLNEYTVPHACGLSVYATELLGIAASTANTFDAVRPALLPVAVTLAALAALLISWRRLETDARFDEMVRGSVGARIRSLWFVAVLFVPAWVVPMIGLAMRLGNVRMMATAVRTYGGDMVATCLVALTTGALAVVMGVAVSASKRTERLCLGWALALGVLPGAIIGVSVIAAFNGPRLGALLDHWPAIAIGNIARFGWIGIVAALLARRMTPRHLSDQARVDGASPGDVFVHVDLATGSPIFVGAGVLIAVLSMGDIATSSLLRVPDFSPIALVIIEKFHRFEDGLLAALSLILVGAGVLTAVLLAWTARIAGPANR